MKVMNQILLTSICFGIAALIVARVGGGSSPDAIFPFVQIMTGLAATVGTIISVTGRTGSIVDTSTAFNISPIINLIVSHLRSGRKPNKLASDLSSGAGAAGTGTVAVKVTEVRALLPPVSADAGVTGTDPLTGMAVMAVMFWPLASRAVR